MTDDEEDELVAMQKALWRASLKTPPETLITVPLRRLFYLSSYSFEAVGMLKTMGLMGGNSRLLAESDRLSRSIRCELGDLLTPHNR